MNRLKTALVLLLILLSLSSLSSIICLANSAEPPGILIIVPNAPDDLEIRLEPENIRANRTDKAFESYYTFYSRDLRSAVYTFQVTTGGETIEVTTNAPINKYNNIYTLDVKKQTLTPGKSISRSFALVSFRVILTLLIEGFLFYLFRYKTKRSWLVFLIVNLFTQGILYIWLTVTTIPTNGYIIFDLIGGEFLVFIVEVTLFTMLINEHPRLLTVLYVILANILSLIAGGYLITLLPI